MGTDGKKRCFGSSAGKEFYAKYHDEEWGIPVHDDRHLFEMLVLEGAQAGLSWETILKRREGYRRAFHQFDPQAVASMSDEELESLRTNTEMIPETAVRDGKVMQDSESKGCLNLPSPSPVSRIIRNRLKIYSARQNARVYLMIQEEFGSFDRYVWGFVNGQPILNHWKNSAEVPTKTRESDALSKDLKKRGMTFVGSTIIYAFMQAVGMVNDHTIECWCYRPV